AYMAPEQFASSKVGPAADIYSLGMVLYELVTGASAFPTDSLPELIRAQLQEPPPPPRQHRPDLPAFAEAAILRAIEKNPDRRFANAGAFAWAFKEGLAGRVHPEGSPGLAGLTMPAQLPGQRSGGAADTMRAVQSDPTMLAQAANMGMYPAYHGDAGPHWPAPSQLTRGAPRGAYGWIVIVGITIVVALLGALALQRFSIPGGPPVGPPASPSTATAIVGTSTAPPIQAHVPVGALLYHTAAPGTCDGQGGQWTQNTQAIQECSDGALVLSNRDCSCPLGVVALAQLPGNAYPADYIAEVSLQPLGADPTAKFGVKFRQPSPQDAA